MKKKFVALSVFLLCLSTGYSAKKLPAWMLEVHDVYPSSEYIAELGDGISLTEAELRGQQKIAQYFESNIDTTTLGRLRMSSVDGSVSQSRTIDTATTVSSNVKLFAIHYSEHYIDKKAKKTYVVAYINRDEAYQMFRTKVDLPAQTFSNFYEKGTKAERNEEYLTAYKFYRSARDQAFDFEENYSFARLLNAKKSSEYDDIHNKVAGIDAKIEEILLKCQIQVEVINDNNGIILAKAKNLFSENGFSVKSTEGNYKATITVTIDEVSLPKGTNCYPHIDVIISKENEAIIVFGKDGEKIAAANADVAKRRAYTAIEHLLEEALTAELISK